MSTMMQQRLNLLQTNLFTVRNAAETFPELFAKVDSILLDCERPSVRIWWATSEVRATMRQAAARHKEAGWVRSHGREGFTWKGSIGGCDFTWENVEDKPELPEGDSPVFPEDEQQPAEAAVGVEGAS